MSAPAPLPAFLPRRFFHPESADARICIAISACLTGAPVRYDGRHQHLQAVDSWLQPLADLLPLCPEMDAGLGTPRPPVQLVETGSGQVIARGRDDHALEVTGALRATAERTLALLPSRRVCGYLWKSRSPSCGLGSTPLFDIDGNEIGRASGLQAAHLRAAQPWLAMAEESELQTVEGAWRFLLRCRLVHDGLYAGAVGTAMLARHHRALHALLPPDQRERVTMAANGTREVYLAALLDACGGVTTARLQALFTAG